MNPQEQKIQELENRIRDLENVSNETYLRNTINALLNNGFLMGTNIITTLYDSGLWLRPINTLMFKFQDKDWSVILSNPMMEIRVQAGSNRIYSKTNLNVGDIVTFSSTDTLPNPLTNGLYDVLTVEPDYFQVDNGSGSPLQITNTGIGVHYYRLG